MTLDAIDNQHLASAARSLGTIRTVANGVFDVRLLVLDMTARMNELPTDRAGAIYAISVVVSYIDE